MLRNSFILIVLLNLTHNVFAQENIYLWLNANDLKAGKVDTSPTSSNVYFYGGTGAGQTYLSIRAKDAYLRRRENGREVILPIGVLNVSAKIGNSNNSAVALSPSWSTIHQIGWQIAGGENVTFNFNLPNVQSFVFSAGSYDVDLDLSAWTERWSIKFGYWVNPDKLKLTMVVPKIFELDQKIEEVNLRVDDFKYFRRSNLLFKALPAINVYQTIEYNAFLESKNSYFDFTNGYNGVNPPLVEFNKLGITHRNDGIGINPIQLGGRRVNVLNNGNGGPGVKVSMDYRVYSIQPDDLKNYFINKGTYSNTIEFSIVAMNQIDANLPPQSVPIPINVIVEDMAELTVNQNQVNILYEDFKGASVEMTDHLTVSKTTPYDISVRAANEYFYTDDGSNMIPSSVLAIGPGSGTYRVNSITSLSTTDQTLVSAANPEVDRKLSLIYSIPPSKEGIMHEYAVPGKEYKMNVIYTLTGR